MKIKDFYEDSSGFTLIELIVVIAIISIITVATILGTGVLGYGKAKSAAARIKSFSDKARLENMTKKEEYYLVIEHLDNSYYISIQTEKNGIRINKSTERLDLRKGKISFENTEGQKYLISSVSMEGVEVTGKLEIEFSKDTGGLKANTDGKIVQYINVESNNKSYKINLVEATGKAYID